VRSPTCRPSSNGWITSPILIPAALYTNDVREFVAFFGLRSFAELRGISRAHVIAWRKDLESRMVKRRQER
jgi:hypothetical protein